MGLEELKPDEMQILELVKEYRDTSEKILFECADIDSQIKKLLEMRAFIAKPYQDKLSDLESEIRLPMLERKASFISSFGSVTYRKGAVRRTWNLDALDQICTAKPEIKNEIWPFRKETIGEPTISIKIEYD